MQSILSFLQGQGLLDIVLGFIILSLVIRDLAQIAQAIGKSLPPGFSTVLNVIGQILHFVNGNPQIFGQAASSAAGGSAPAAQPAAAPAPASGPSA